MDSAIEWRSDPRGRGRVRVAALLLAVFLVGCFGTRYIWTGSLRDMAPTEALAAVKQDPDPAHVRGASVALYRFVEDSVVALLTLSRGDGPVADNAKAMLANLRNLLKE